MNAADQTTHFGFRDVPLRDKQTLVNDVFHSVAQRYDLQLVPGHPIEMEPLITLRPRHGMKMIARLRK